MRRQANKSSWIFQKIARYGRFWVHLAGIRHKKYFPSPDFQAFFGRSATASA
ncbi:MAG: hypothetical protein H8M99_05260 [Gloeobacteraceae cyanobacterium ES-bin-144]|nr:hypothetical protein [Verrucomicrobiales bacterium]